MFETKLGSGPNHGDCDSKVRHDPSTNDFEFEDESAKELLKDVDNEDHEVYGLAEDVEMGSNGRHPQRDYSRWMRQLGLLFAILCLATVAFASINSLLRSSHISLNVFNVFHLGSVGKDQSRKIGIELHPKNHAYRQPTTIAHDWAITSDILSPDGVKKRVYMINGEFPGPTIQCRSGDKLAVRVANQLLNESISIHWHGLQMRNANSMDGAAGFTQCPIPPGSSFTYEFDIHEEQHGTFWYHAHAQTQRGDGMYGGLVVHKPAIPHSDLEVYGYKKEMLFLVGDWYHRSGDEVLSWYTSVKGFGNEPVPDSLVINGVGRFLCSMAVPARPVDCEDIQEELFLGIPAKGTTRLRIVNVGTLTGFTLQTDSGTLKPITLDGGHAIEGSPRDSVGILYPGERVDLISTWNKDARTPRLQISLDRENFKYPNHALRPDQPFAVLESQNGDTLNYNETLTMSLDSHFDIALANSVQGSSVSMAQTAQQTLLLYAKAQKLAINANHPQGFMNRTSWSPQAHPLLSTPRSDWDKNQLVPFIQSNSSSPQWVDIIINNLDEGSHPFHLHGHDFYVLASHRSDHGWGSYSPWASKGDASLAPLLNLESPLVKDTVSVPRRGFVVLRILADNPGIWMLHCHVLFHQGSGMAMGLHVGESEAHEDVNLSAAQFCPDER